MVKTTLMFVFIWLMLSAAYLGIKASDKSFKKQLAKALLFGAVTATAALVFSAIIINVF